MYENGGNVTYFDSLQVEYIPKKVKRFTFKENVTRMIYRIQSSDQMVCGYFFIGFIDFMLKGKSLVDFTNLFSPNEYQKNNKAILEKFQYLETRSFFCE